MIFHGFWDEKGTGMDVMEINIAQELTRIYHDPLFLVILDLRKSYDTVDRGCLIQTLENYGAITHLCGLLAMF